MIFSAHIRSIDLGAHPNGPMRLELELNPRLVNTEEKDAFYDSIRDLMRLMVEQQSVTVAVEG